MTIKELYANIGGNYDQAVRVMKADKLIDRYVRKLKNSAVGETLVAAGKTMDPQQLFDSAHAMKGVCSNLGLDALAAAADAITEEFRQGNPRRMTDDEVRSKLADIAALYAKTVEGIARYEQEN